MTTQMILKLPAVVTSVIINCEGEPLRLAMRMTTGMNMATTPAELLTEPSKPSASIRILI